MDSHVREFIFRWIVDNLTSTSALTDEAEAEVLVRSLFEEAARQGISREQVVDGLCLAEFMVGEMAKKSSN